MSKVAASRTDRTSPHRPPSRLSPPFDRQSNPFISQSPDKAVEYELRFPAVIHPRPHFLRPKKNPSEFLRWELETTRLDRIYQHLWLAGAKVPARPLHRQKMLRRPVVITENVDEHLLVSFSVIFVKPLPEYLLSYDFWETHICSNHPLYRRACGFLLSYTWLVAFESDFKIAQEEHLIPQSLNWTTWTTIVDYYLDLMDRTGGQHVSSRYHYGELDIRKLNYIYKLTPSLMTWDNLNCGFLSASRWYRPFLDRNLTRLLALLVFFSVILSAMQVGIATDRLRNNTSFQEVSYGFAVASLVFVIFGASAILGAWIVPAVYRISRFRLTKDGS
jgi:hypothetical protein